LCLSKPSRCAREIFSFFGFGLPPGGEGGGEGATSSNRLADEAAVAPAAGGGAAGLAARPTSLLPEEAPIAGGEDGFGFGEDGDEDGGEDGGEDGNEDWPLLARAAFAARAASLLLEEVPCRLRAPAMPAMPLLPPWPKPRKTRRAALLSCLLPCALSERDDLPYPGAPGRPGRWRSSVIPMCVSSTSSNSRTSVTPCLRMWAITSGMQY